MTGESFEESIAALMAIVPFKPFTIELNTGQRFEVDHPGTLLWKGSPVVYKIPGGPLAFFDHESVNQIINRPAHVAPGKRRSK
jgi:hypothetical protein